jgi:hypothetical protein
VIQLELEVRQEEADSNSKSGFSRKETAHFPRDPKASSKTFENAQNFLTQQVLWLRCHPATASQSSFCPMCSCVPQIPREKTPGGYNSTDSSSKLRECRVPATPATVVGLNCGRGCISQWEEAWKLAGVALTTQMVHWEEATPSTAVSLNCGRTKSSGSVPRVQAFLVLSYSRSSGNSLSPPPLQRGFSITDTL